MKRFVLALTLVVSLSGVALFGVTLPGVAFSQELPAKPGGAAAQDPVQLTRDASYSIGLSIGQRMKQDQLELDVQRLLKGLTDGLTGAQAELSEEQMDAAIGAFQRLQQQKLAERMRIQGQAAMAKGKAFLDANAKKEGVVALPSGLQYKVVKKGTGPSPTAEDTVRTHYRGTTIAGAEFDSSYKRNMPATFPVTGVIKGWTEALQRMKVGDKWMLYIPPELAYGARGAGDAIGPNETLIFEIELLGIE